MKQTRILMGMPITLEVPEDMCEKIFSYFKYVDETFSTYKETSEIMKINRKELETKDWSKDMKTVFALSERTKKESDGYFDIVTPQGAYDPSGLVKGWAIWNAAKIARNHGCRDFYIDAGGDVQTNGRNAEGRKWSVGIKNPFNQKEIVKTVYLSGEGIATSGTYLRGEHIYDPKTGKPANEIASLTVIGPNVYEADRFATAAFAMGARGIQFMAGLDGFEAYMVDAQATALYTPGFTRYLAA